MARLVFSETAGEPGLLPDSIKQADFTVVRFDDESVQALEVAEVDGNPFMRSPPLHSPALLIAKCTYGVHKKILLHYTAKHWTDMTSLPIQPQSAPELDMTLQQSGNTLTLHVRWQGKPLADANVVYQHGDDQAELSTDENGSLQISAPPNQLLVFRAHHTASRAAGELNGQPYQEERHYCTATVAASEPAANQSVLPELPEAVSSFGAVVVDDRLYVYSGHTGEAHAHSLDNLATRFLAVNLSQHDGWQKLPMEQPLQGFPLVSHGGQVIRIGGLHARNRHDEPADLHSTATVSVFDPQANAWHAADSLPEARSSHDATVLGDCVFVFGGWTLTGDSEGQWLDYGLQLDRTKSDGWQKIPQPFVRRALTVVAHQGRIYAMGGMTEDHEVSRRVDIYDPANQTWSEGPELPGAGLQGFGVSACSLDGQLFVSGWDGKLLCWQDDQQQWAEVSSWKQGRFFHQLIGHRGQILAIGGASRAGHLANTEAWRLPE